LREISLLQQRARALETEIAHRKQLEEALRDALRECGRIEEELRTCVRREQEGRARAETNDAYKEMFLGILGHDLRNPLNTVLTTAQLMKLRGEVPPAAAPRLDRIVSSGQRMERMISQLLDVTRARLAGGIAVNRTQEHDLASIARKIVDEVRAANPGRRIDLSADQVCPAYLDPDRLEQVVSNLVGNAVVHGDSERPITVAVSRHDNFASLAVHNFGSPIDAGMMPALFDPFKRRADGHDRPAGLGLGLYIADQIVGAHGGEIKVESTVDRGTRFEVIIPV
jgi:signal transduction histidine kinase